MGKAKKKGKYPTYEDFRQYRKVLLGRASPTKSIFISSGSAARGPQKVVDIASNSGEAIPVTQQLASAASSDGGGLLSGIKSAVGEVAEGFAYGDKASSDSIAANVGSVLADLTAFGDITSPATAAYGIYQGKEGAWGSLGLAALGAVPIVGDAGKQLIKHGGKAIDAFGEARPLNKSATGPVAADGVAADGFVYLRTDTTGRLKPYFGQTTEANQLAREGAHVRAFPDSRFNL